jgi:hypothetical protein
VLQNNSYIFTLLFIKIKNLYHEATSQLLNFSTSQLRGSRFIYIVLLSFFLMSSFTLFAQQPQGCQLVIDPEFDTYAGKYTGTTEPICNFQLDNNFDNSPDRLEVLQTVHQLVMFLRLIFAAMHKQH